MRSADWEPKCNETRILFLYRQYDAISSLIGATSKGDQLRDQLNADRQQIMTELCDEIPIGHLDHAAQTVIMAIRGWINVPLAELKDCLGILNCYIEIDETGIDMEKANASLLGLGSQRASDSWARSVRQ